MQTTHSMDRKIVSSLQWRTQKIFMGGISIRGIWWSLVFGVRCL